eukprot:PhF_6_TR29871/c0_g1_i2/m.43824
MKILMPQHHFDVLQQLTQHRLSFDKLHREVQLTMKMRPGCRSRVNRLQHLTTSVICMFWRISMQAVLKPNHYQYKTFLHHVRTLWLLLRNGREGKPDEKKIKLKPQAPPPKPLTPHHFMRDLPRIQLGVRDNILIPHRNPLEHIVSPTALAKELSLSTQQPQQQVPPRVQPQSAGSRRKQLIDRYLKSNHYAEQGIVTPLFINGRGQTMTKVVNAESSLPDMRPSTAPHKPKVLCNWHVGR